MRPRYIDRNGIDDSFAYGLLFVISLFASLFVFGCEIPLPPVPTPEPEMINIQSTETASASICDCGCGQDGCRCSLSSRPSTRERIADTTAGSGPQGIKTQKVYQCRNGVCGWYDTEPLTGNQSKLPASTKVVIWDNGSPAGQAMRAAIGQGGIEWKNDQPPLAINGVRWSPTAVKPDGSAWTPGANGWHAGSAAQFEAWRQAR